MPNKLSIAFFGTPTFATFVLDELIALGYTPSLIVTTPDKPSGRGLELTEPPVKKYALSKNIPVLQPAKLDAAFIEELQSRNIDILIVAAYGKILPDSLLSALKYPPLNVHPSLLPKYRGTSPVESQLLADEKNIGVTIINMDKEMDHGQIVAQEKIDIPNWPISRDELNDILWHKGGKLLGSVLADWVDGTIEPKLQNHEEATFTKKIGKSDGKISLENSGKENYLKYLAYKGWPGTYFFDKENKRVIIKDAKYENGIFTPTRVVYEGKKETDFIPPSK